ncbi:MAG: DNA-processing protein DprA [Eubacteriales bacterium]|nr:DNA-processing protein DprA [Eubacteriales bacterium]
MNQRERGFLLLTSHLGDPERRVLTVAQLRTLAMRMRDMEIPMEDRELTESDLLRLGCDREMSARILSLLEQEDLLDGYLARAAAQNCVPVTRVSDHYPQILRQRLGLDSPGCLWARGDVAILNTPAISLVGCRELNEPNREFAEAVGYQAAVQGLTLVSGNARGADRAAQEACLKAGGRVISIVADSLNRFPPRNLLYLSEDGFDEEFSAQRALSRNRCIHALGRMVFVAQSDLQKGGTWSGTVKNLRFGWSPVACFRDGSEAAAQLEQMGAYQIGLLDLRDFACLQTPDNFLW